MILPLALYEVGFRHTGWPCGTVGDLFMPCKYPLTMSTIHFTHVALPWGTKHLISLKLAEKGVRFLLSSYIQRWLTLCFPAAPFW